MPNTIDDSVFEKIEIFQLQLNDVTARRIAPHTIRLYKASLLPKIIDDLVVMCKNAITSAVSDIYGNQGKGFVVQSELHFNDQGEEDLPLYIGVYLVAGRDFQYSKALIEELQNIVVKLTNSILGENLFNTHSGAWSKLTEELDVLDKEEQIEEIVNTEIEKFLGQHGGKQITSSVSVVIPRDESESDEAQEKPKELVVGTLQGYLERPRTNKAQEQRKECYVVADGIRKSKKILFLQEVSIYSTLSKPILLESEEYIFESYNERRNTTKALDDDDNTHVFKIHYTFVPASKGKSKELRLNSLTKLSEEDAIKVLNQGATTHTQTDLFNSGSQKA